MKKYILMTVASMMLVSCLDTIILPDDKTVDEDFWQSKADVASMVNAAYAGMTEEALVERLIVWSDFRSDELVQSTAPQGGVPNALAEIDAANMQVTNTYASWAPFYAVINRCNIVLDRAAEVMNVDPNYTEGDYLADRSQMLALRSLCYFYLVRNFRDVPYVDYSYMSSSQSTAVAQSSPDYVLERCIESCEEAVQNAIDSRSFGVSEWRRVGWFTADGIRSLLADLYLWRASATHNSNPERSAADYQKCVDYCDAVIESKKNQHVRGRDEVVEKEYPLANAADAYNDLFVDQNAEESIFELQIRTNHALCKYLYKYANNNNLEGFLKASSIFATTSTTANITQATGDKVFAYNDIRFYGSIYSTAANAEATSFEVRKMISTSPLRTLQQQTRESARTFSGLDQNYIIYRLSDVMLMRAEALVQLAADDDDIMLRDAFNMVQAVSTRSLLTANLTDSLKWASLANMQRAGKIGEEQLVMEERLRELCFEGKRWYDLMRYNYRHTEGVRYDLTFGQIVDEGIALPTNYENMLSLMVRGRTNNTGDGVKAKMRNESYLYLPIPNSDVVLDPLLRQNPAYKNSNEFEKNY